MKEEGCHVGPLKPEREGGDEMRREEGSLRVSLGVFLPPLFLLLLLSHYNLQHFRPPLFSFFFLAAALFL